MGQEAQYSLANRMIIFITGGARSGKSRYAQELALQVSQLPVYLATARRWDPEFGERIDRHRRDRDERWTLIEEEKRISQAPIGGKTVVIDCVTLWINNFFADTKGDLDACLELCKAEIDALEKMEGDFIIISNEIGMGLHADSEVGRKFTDLHGWVNQYIAQKATRAVLMVSGLPLIIKDGGR